MNEETPLAISVQIFRTEPQWGLRGRYPRRHPHDQDRPTASGPCAGTRTNVGPCRRAASVIRVSHIIRSSRCPGKRMPGRVGARTRQRVNNNDEYTRDG
jgi:hypothetical protein